MAPTLRNSSSDFLDTNFDSCVQPTPRPVEERKGVKEVIVEMTRAAAAAKAAA